MALVHSVSQQLVSRYLAVSANQRADAEALKAAPLRWAESDLLSSSPTFSQW
jgi:hypothetical protein